MAQVIEKVEMTEHEVEVSNIKEEIKTIKARIEFRQKEIETATRKNDISKAMSLLKVQAQDSDKLSKLQVAPSAMVKSSFQSIIADLSEEEKLEMYNDLKAGRINKLFGSFKINEEEVRFNAYWTDSDK